MEQLVLLKGSVLFVWTDEGVWNRELCKTWVYYSLSRLTFLSNAQTGIAAMLLLYKSLQRTWTKTAVNGGSMHVA